MRTYENDEVDKIVEWVRRDRPEYDENKCLEVYMTCSSITMRKKARA